LKKKLDMLYDSIYHKIRILNLMTVILTGRRHRNLAIQLRSGECDIKENKIYSLRGNSGMKRLFVLLCLLFLLLPAFLFSQDMGGWTAAYGDWKMVGDRLVQSSTKAGMAQAYMRLPQSGIMEYQFDVKYVDGGADMFGAFGFHIGIDSAAGGKSWGNGKSFLLWLTLDPKVYGGSGVYGQAYYSEAHSIMDLVHGATDYQLPMDRLKDINLDRMAMYALPVRVRINYNTGDVKVWDPAIPKYYYRFNLGGPVRGGNYISVRSNSLAVSFGNFSISRPSSF
jgi:hypothetical protein